MINGGGIIKRGRRDPRHRPQRGLRPPPWVAGKLDRLMLTLGEVMDRSLAEKRPTHEVANEMARARITLAADQKAAA